MKKRPLIVIQLCIISVLLITLATSCKKDNDDTETVTDIDGNVYKTGTIGTQVWFKENLKTTKYNDGSAIPLVTDNTEWSTLITHGFCWYNNDKAAYGNIYGAYYNWYAVASGKLCPTGWHVPSDDEWTIMTDFLGGESISGNKLKETGTAHWLAPTGNETNETGFTALPGEARYQHGFFGSPLGDHGFWWTSTGYSDSNSWYRIMVSSRSTVERANDMNKKCGFSVRCIKD